MVRRLGEHRYDRRLRVVILVGMAATCAGRGAAYLTPSFSGSDYLSLLAGRVITMTELESRYGLRVNLVALTAAGGMLDVRLKIVDAQKAALLLGSPDHFPVVAVDGSPVRLNAPPEARTQAAHLIDGGGMLVIFPNTGNTVHPDTKVRLVFGDVQIESISVR